MFDMLAVCVCVCLKPHNVVLSRSHLSDLVIQSTICWLRNGETKDWQMPASGYCVHAHTHARTVQSWRERLHWDKVMFQMDVRSAVYSVACRWCCYRDSWKERQYCPSIFYGWTVFSVKLNFLVNLDMGTLQINFINEFLHKFVYWITHQLRVWCFDM